MKRKLLILFCLIFTLSFGYAQVVADQTDDFEDGTTQSWKHKLTNAGEPVNISSGGPGGVDDNYLTMSNNGTNGSPGARHIMFNTDSRWTGGSDYTATGIVAIRMDVNNTGAEDLHLRVAFRGGPGVTWISTTNPVVVGAGSGWTTIEIPILSGDFTVSQGSDTAAQVLEDVNTEMRILSNDGNDTSPQAALHKGDLRVQTSNFDNIRAVTSFLSTKERSKPSNFKISPNPSSRELNLNLSRLDNNTNVEVFDVLGKKIYADRIENLNKSIDVSQWNNGVYLVRLTSDNGTQTKRFVKQ